MQRPLAIQKQSARFAVGAIELPGRDEPDFNAFFRHMPGIFVATRPDLTIAAASDDMLRKTFTWREQIIGRNLFEVFPDNPSAEAQGAKKMETSLRDVLTNGTAHSIRVIRYDIQDRLSGEGVWIEKYWTAISRPVIDRTNREVLYVLTESRDVTRIIHLALWLEHLDAKDEFAPDIQRAVLSAQRDARGLTPHVDRVRARIAEEMKLTGATQQTLVGELKALLRSPENRLYASKGFRSAN
ncbi:MAG TPA: PAS domain-containing protein [Candidatus Krumholzibacteria bacterium]|nr:PAS domain-containing protein [Candidatus Krumholzibacteria bacterium]